MLLFYHSNCESQPPRSFFYILDTSTNAPTAEAIKIILVKTTIMIISLIKKSKFLILFSLKKLSELYVRFLHFSKAAYSFGYAVINIRLNLWRLLSSPAYCYSQPHWPFPVTISAVISGTASQLKISQNGCNLL